MTKRITITYDVTTPESAEHGDYADTGWIDEEGVDCTPDECDIDEAKDTLWDGRDDEPTKEESELAALVTNAVKVIQGNGGVEASSSEFHAGVWYTQCDADQDFSNGEDTRHSFHLNDFLPEEEEAIYKELGN